MSPFDRLLRLMTKPGVASLYIALVCLSFFYFDKSLALYFHDLDLRTHFFLLTWLTKLGLGPIYIVPFFILAIYFRYVKPNPVWEARFWFLFLCLVIPGTVCGILKVILSRARPDLWFSEHLYGFYWLQLHAPFWSFPSGHTTTILAAALGLSILFPQYYYRLVVVGVAIAISRVVLTHHYLSDILTAAYLTVLELGLLMYVLRQKSWLGAAWDVK